MVYAFVTPTTSLGASAFTGAGGVTAPQGHRSGLPVTGVHASLGECIVRRARQDAAKVADAFSNPAVRGAALGLFAAAALSIPSANALTRSDIDQLTYLQVKGTGVANRCPEVIGSKGTIKLDSGKSYRLTDLCLEPKSFQVEEEIETKRKGEVKRVFVDTKLMTRATYTLTGIEGDLKVNGNELTFEEKEGIDYAATTVQLPGGERVPFLFTIKGLVAKASGGDITTATEFGGDFKVPSYRTGLFLDPKVCLFSARVFISLVLLSHMYMLYLPNRNLFFFPPLFLSFWHLLD